MSNQGMQQAIRELSTQGRILLILYDYTESGATKRCGFICSAKNIREAAESFWNQHPGEWFRLVSVNDGEREAFWSARCGAFITIPDEAKES